MKKWWVLAVVAVALVSGCSKQSDTKSAEKLVIYNWTEYIPDDLLAEFTEETGIEVEYATYESNEAMYARIKLLGGSGYDLAVPSTFYVEKMRNEGLLQPIDKSLLTNYGNLDNAMLDKPYDPGNEYSIPYLWGSTAIAVNGNDVDASAISSWADLWKPEYQGKIMLMDDVRDTFHAALSVKGYSNNTTDENEIREAYELLRELMPSVKTFNSDSPKVPLVQGNVSIGVIWNGEAYMAQEEMDNLVYIYPEEGAVLWVDSFVIPKNAANVENAHKFIDFVLRAESAKACTEELGYAAPNTAMLPLLDEALRNNPIVFPAEEDIARGSFHQDLGDAVLIYEKYWEMLKAGR
ncbi:MAG TPA: extracellular solute-binding protein [Cellvibrionaceae bacterium]